MTPKDASAYAREICGLAPVIPVIVVNDVAHAVPLAEALVAGGLPVLEVTLRTPAALDVIRAMAEVEGGVVGAGTLLTPEDVRAAKAAGARFGVSPGVTDALVDACEAEELPLLGGIADGQRGDADARARLRRLQVLPGRGERRRAGAEVLRRARCRRCSFCPTGGVTPKNAPDYLALPNVLCVGGSWVADPKLLEAGRWDEVERLARDASKLER